MIGRVETVHGRRTLLVVQVQKSRFGLLGVVVVVVVVGTDEALLGLVQVALGVGLVEAVVEAVQEVGMFDRVERVHVQRVVELVGGVQILPVGGRCCRGHLSVQLEIVQVGAVCGLVVDRGA